MTLRPVTLILTAIAMSAAGAASAQIMQPPSVVTMVRTGWGMDSFAVVTAGPVGNPAKCATPDGYISDKSLPGYQTYYSAALAAIASHLHVVVTVHKTQCFMNRPILIGINLLP
jgi:hypothetical protein